MSCSTQAAGPLGIRRSMCVCKKKQSRRSYDLVDSQRVFKVGARKGRVEAPEHIRTAQELTMVSPFENES